MEGCIEEAVQYYQKAATVAVSSATFTKYSSEAERCREKLEMIDATDDE
jgi:hypothetical protein